VLVVRAVAVGILQAAELHRAQQEHQDKAMLVVRAVQHLVGQVVAVVRQPLVLLEAQVQVEMAEQVRLHQLLVHQ
jgi:hypothetical protein